MQGGEVVQMVLVRTEYSQQVMDAEDSQRVAENEDLHAEACDEGYKRWIAEDAMW